MFRTRFWMLVTMLGLMAVPLLATAGYGLYLRSGMYATAMARQASAFLGAPVQIGGVVPLDATSQGFRDVAVWLPGEFSPVFTCKLAIVRLVDSQGVELDLRDGRIEVRTDDWGHGRLAQLMAVAFAHDFQRVKLKSVRLDNMDLVARRDGKMVWADDASGQVDLSGQTGRADLVCDGLNGVKAGEPIHIRCTFEPGEKPLIRELSLTVRRLGMEVFLPVKARTAGCRLRATGDKEQVTAGNNSGQSAEDKEQQVRSDGGERKSKVREAVPSDLSPVTCPLSPVTCNLSPVTCNLSPVTCPLSPAPCNLSSPAGWFSGNISYRQMSPESLAGLVEVSGNLEDVNLASLAARAGKSDLAGIINGTLDKAVLDDGHVQSLQARLRADGLNMKGLLALAGLPPAEGSATLNLHELRYEGGSLQALLADAEIRDLEVEPLLRATRIGAITGRLHALLQRIKVVDGRLVELAGEAKMSAPAAGTTGTIDRSILEAAAQRFLNVSLPPILPEKVPYADFGARFRTEEDSLYVDGVAGPEDKFVLVVDAGSMPMPLVPAPTEPLAMKELQAYVEMQVNRLGRVMADWASQKLEPQE